MNSSSPILPGRPALVKTSALIPEEMDTIIHAIEGDAALARLLPALPGTSPAVALIRETAANFRSLKLTDEVSVAVALNLVAVLAAELVAAGAPRGKVVNALPTELRNKLQVALPFKNPA